MRTVLGVVCALVALMAFGVSIVGFVEIVSGTATAGGYGAFGFLFGLGSLSTYGALRNLRPRKQRAIAADPTKHVLALAATEGGRVTAAEVVAKTPLSLPEARQALATLASHNMVTSVITEQGVEVFQVKGLLGPAEKASARDILDG